MSQSGDTKETVFLKKLWWIFNICSLPVLLIAIYIIGDTVSPTVDVLNTLFVLSLVVPLVVFHFNKNQIENYAFFTQLAFVLITSAKVYYMGGMLNTGTPIYVGFIAPVFALIFPNKNRAQIIFFLFLSLMITATILNAYNELSYLVSHYFVGFVIGTTCAFFTIYYFTTQLEKAKKVEKERLKELDDLKTKFYTHITHEFRTPLSVITGVADQIKKDPDKWLNKGHAIIKRNSKNLIELTNKLLDLAKLEAKAMSLNLIQDDIVLYLQYLIESFHSLSEVKNIHLSFKSEPEEIEMDFDPDKIRDIITNLLSNAIKFTPKNGSIYISAKLQQTNGEKHLAVKVKDTGVGIPKEELNNIFNKYFQAKNHFEALEEGSGLGLALTQELVKLMRGNISVESDVGKGSTFTIHLPVTNFAKEIHVPFDKEISFTDTELKVSNEDTTTHLMSGNKKKLEILIVEDNQDVSNYLKSLLLPHYNTSITKDGKQGFKMALQLIPDLIVSDVMMPKMDGYALCEKIKQDIRTSHIPIILLTARVDSKSKLEGLNVGADAYLTKPFNHKELFIRIKELINLRKTLQDHYKSTTFGHTAKNTLHHKEDVFIKKLRNILEEHLADEAFGITQLCSYMAMSRSQLYRKFSALTDTTVNQFIKSLRLEKARELLQTTDLNVSEVAYDTGFKNPAHFSRVYTNKFGYAPSKTKDLTTEY